jgi:hypothetical protein
MWKTRTYLCAVAIGLAAQVWTPASQAAESGKVAAASEPATSSNFTAAQRDRVRVWIRELLPECPRAAALRAVDAFLEELQRRSPGSVDRLVEPEFDIKPFQSLLVRHVGAQLTDPLDAAVREQAARLRVRMLMVPDGTQAAKADETELVAKIREMPGVHWRRLLEGRMDDDEVLVLLRKARGTATAVAKAEAAPKVLSAGEIVSEFVRRNQEGAALQRLRATTVHGKLEMAGGEELDIVLWKLRPDRFRLAVRSQGLTQVVTAFDGTHYWQQRPGQRPQTLSLEAVGPLRYLAEFVDPLFADQGVEFARLEDRTVPGELAYRIAVTRKDGSRYVAWIDRESFQQIGREVDDGVVVRYSDFRKLMGLTIAFREESVDAHGKRSVLTIDRITPNPGLVQAFFEKRDPSYPAVVDMERLIQPALAKTSP